MSSVDVAKDDNLHGDEVMCSEKNEDKFVSGGRNSMDCDDRHRSGQSRRLRMKRRRAQIRQADREMFMQFAMNERNEEA